MKESEWDPKYTDFTREVIDRRIQTLLSYTSWQETIHILNKKERKFDALKVAEVGCGTGTFSLALCLLGASVTLLDFNEKVLENAEKIYELYNCKAQYIRADCLKEPPPDIEGVFDLVISGGLAEHFAGGDREACIGYHRELLAEGGFTCIGVPNKFSPFYQEVRLFRRLTGTWNISQEIPFSSAELEGLAKRAGFDSFYILGNSSLAKDFIVYSRGLVSAAIDILPKNIKYNFRKRKSKITEKLTASTNIIEEIVNSTRKNNCKQANRFGPSRFSAGLVLFGFK
jgi:SAM-dependent methyltransferase